MVSVSDGGSCSSPILTPMLLDPSNLAGGSQCGPVHWKALAGTRVLPDPLCVESLSQLPGRLRKRECSHSSRKGATRLNR